MEYEKDLSYLFSVLANGTRRANELAETTLEDVKRCMKLKYFDQRTLTMRG